jgi:hypothetical protein
MPANSAAVNLSYIALQWEFGGLQDLTILWDRASVGVQAYALPAI